MLTELLSPEALRDLKQIIAHIARSRPKVAAKILDKFEAAIDLLADMPELGSLSDLVPGKSLRHWTIAKRYVIYYRFHPLPIEVVRIVDGSRDVGNVEFE